MKKRKKRTSYEIQKDKTWKAFSVYIRTRKMDSYGYSQCVTCGGVGHWKDMQAGHFIRGRGNSVLFDDNCVHVQCYRCNVIFSGNYVEYTLYMLKEYGEEEVDRLRGLKNISRKFTESELKELEEKYKQKTEENEE